MNLVIYSNLTLISFFFCSCSDSLNAVRAIDAVGCLVNSSVISHIISVHTHTADALKHTCIIQSPFPYEEVLP